MRLMDGMLCDSKEAYCRLSEGSGMSGAAGSCPFAVANEGLAGFDVPGCFKLA